MDIIIWKEIHFFTISILYGVGILLIYDGFRIIRKLFKHNTVLIALEDLIYWISTAIIIFSLLYTYNNGSVRGYAILGMAIGMIAYARIASRLILMAADKVIGIFKKVLYKYLQKPYRKVKNQLKKLIKAVKIAIKGK